MRNKLKSLVLKNQDLICLFCLSLVFMASLILSAVRQGGDDSKFVFYHKSTPFGGGLKCDILSLTADSRLKLLYG